MPSFDLHTHQQPLLSSGRRPALAPLSPSLSSETYEDAIRRRGIVPPPPPPPSPTSPRLDNDRQQGSRIRRSIDERKERPRLVHCSPRRGAMGRHPTLTRDLTLRALSVKAEEGPMTGHLCDGTTHAREYETDRRPLLSEDASRNLFLWADDTTGSLEVATGSQTLLASSRRRTIPAISPTDTSFPASSPDDK
ncbi:MAG: hypothetical protein M1825_005109 [Sarcosagium campestre]|nr:MAG: hypothetical protein M1825_005109 [Sarcosagium campestre]